MPGGRSKVTFAAEPTNASSQATISMPGRLTERKGVLFGSGTQADPYIGTFIHTAANFNTGTVSLALMSERGYWAWMKIKKVHIFYQGTAGVTIWLGAGMIPTDASGVGGECPIGRPITTTNATADVLEWDFGPDGLLFWRSEDVYPTAATPGAWSGELAVELSGYSASDDFWLYAEIEWAVEE